jgi:hypothetical protein
MVVVKDRKYLKTCRVNLGEFFGVAEADAFVELREPSVLEQNALATASAREQAALARGEAPDHTESIEAMKKLVAAAIVDHSLYETEEKKLPGDQVAAIIFDVSAMFSKVVEVYKEEILFTLGRRSAAT